MKKILILIALAVIFSAFYSICYSKTETYQLDLQSENVISIDFSIKTGQGHIKSDNGVFLKNNFNYYTESKEEIIYIIHYLNSINLIDDGKVLNAGDLSIVNINIIKEGGASDKVKFIQGRFCNVDDSQFDVNQEEYKCFMDFIYALKTEKIKLNDNVRLFPSEWAKEDVEQAINSNLVPKRNQIDYTGKITRLDVCQIIKNYLNTNNTQPYTDLDSTPQFKDVDDSSITYLWENGIISGKSETNFCPYDFITREELAKILSNVYYYMNSDIKFKDNKISFQDRAKISDWAVDSVDDMSSLGILIGNENGDFEPQRNITKEEVIVALLRLDFAINN